MTQRILVISVLSCLFLLLAAPGCGDRQEDQCANDSDCQADEVCQNGQCVARQDGGGGDDDDTTCSTAADCPAGEGCLAAEGVCGSCRVASECREGEACIDGVCGGCQTSTDCNGGLCTEGECAQCQSPDDDQRCQDEYGDPDYSCQDEGTCGPETCASGVECQLNDQVCSAEGRCVDCEDTYDCLDDQIGGYPDGTLCIEGKCVGDCETDSECSYLDDLPCTVGVCDGYGCREHYREGVICQYEAAVDMACPDGTGCGRDLRKRTRDRYCSGNSGGCNGSLGDWSSWSLYTDCESWESCDAASDSCINTRVAGRWWLCNPGEVHDELNGLSWKRTAEYYYTWQEAIDYCNGLGNGWRLPNINELRMIIKGCPGTETGGACPVVDPGCLAWACQTNDCMICDLFGGPGEGGYYWEPGVWDGTCPNG